MKVHRRQFLIGPREVVFAEGVKAMWLSSGHCLSYEQDLPLVVSKDMRTLIIGHAFCSDVGVSASSLVETLKDVESETKSWVGRWIVYRDGSLYSDVTTSLSLFYPQFGEFWVSSSVALLSEVVKGLERPEMVFKELNHLAPTTCVKGIKQVMIGEKVDLPRGQVVWQGFSPFERRSLVESEILSLLTSRFRTAVKALQECEVQICSALTSGQDSRLDLAALLSAQNSISFSTFTFVKKFLFMNPGDRDLPKEIASDFGFFHRAITKGKFVPEMEEIYKRHCWTIRSLEPGSPYFYLQNGFWQQLPFRSINVDHCYEIGRNTLYGKGHAGRAEDFTIDDLRNDGYVVEFDDYVRLNEYCSLVSADFGIDRRDFLYLYKSYPLFGKLFQSQDLWVDSLFLGNSREIFSLLLSVSPDLREHGRFHRMLVRSLFAPLSRYPYNPTQPFWQKIFVKMVAWIQG